MIEVDKVSKFYKIENKRSGVSGYLKDLFKTNNDIKEAVKDISFNIKKGEIIGYIGPNGAGKSTTIKMMTGILKPDTGSITIAGYIPLKRDKGFLRKIGVMFGNRSQLWWDLAVTESFDLHKKIYAIDDLEYNKNLEDLVELLDLNSLLNQPVRTLSLGQRIKCDLAMALLHSPDVLFLDEPTVGLDVYVKDKIREFIKEVNLTKETTIILTSHDLTDIEKLANRILIIDKGELIYNDNLDRINSLYETHINIAIKFSEKVVHEELKKSVSFITKNYKLTKHNDFDYDLIITSEETVNMLFKMLANKYLIKDISIQHDKLEQVIKKIYIS